VLNVVDDVSVLIVQDSQRDIDSNFSTMSQSNLNTAIKRLNFPQTFSHHIGQRVVYILCLLENYHLSLALFRYACAVDSKYSHETEKKCIVIIL